MALPWPEHDQDLRSTALVIQMARGSPAAVTGGAAAPELHSCDLPAVCSVTICIAQALVCAAVPNSAQGGMAAYVAALAEALQAAQVPPDLRSFLERSLAATQQAAAAGPAPQQQGAALRCLRMRTAQQPAG